MKIIANLIKIGNVLEHKGKKFHVLNTNTIKPGKGGAYIQVEMRDIKSGAKVNERFRTSENIEKLSVNEILVTFLFIDDNFITVMNNENFKSASNLKDPVTSFFGNLNNLNWKQVYKGFKEYIASIDDVDELKLIKMDPGVSVPMHSHAGKEYILVLDGSFCDEYGEYFKGDIQINDQKIKHTPIASKDTGCVCLSITEKDVIFFGRYGSFLNLFTFIKSFFKQK